MAGVQGDDDPRIYQDEIVAPTVDSRDPAWVPVYEWHSGEVGDGRGANSLACSGNGACEDYKMAAQEDLEESK